MLENEGEIEEIKKMPFRNYLLEYVVPELNDGLVEVSNFLPDDPVEFLVKIIYINMMINNNYNFYINIYRPNIYMKKVLSSLTDIL